MEKHSLDDDVQDNDSDDTGAMSDGAFEKIDATLGTGDKKVVLTSKPITMNEILKLSKR